jgi:hypothetical protein
MAGSAVISGKNGNDILYQYTAATQAGLEFPSDLPAYAVTADGNTYRWNGSAWVATPGGGGGGSVGATGATGATGAGATGASGAGFTPAVLSLSANSATPAVDTDTYNAVEITGQSATITGFTVTGTPAKGDTLEVSITGTAAVAITWGSSFESSTQALPSTTVTTARLDVTFLWNAATSKWRCLGVA